MFKPGRAYPAAAGRRRSHRSRVSRLVTSRARTTASQLLPAASASFRHGGARCGRGDRTAGLAQQMTYCLRHAGPHNDGETGRAALYELAV